MPATTQRHSTYGTASLVWKRCRDSRIGEDAIKAAGEIYLPRLGGQDDNEYNAYKLRGRYYTAFGKTIDGHTGLAMRKGMNIEQPDGLEPTTDNIDRKGADIDAYYKELLGQILEVGRAGTLVDYTRVDMNSTLAEASSARPYWIQYKAEDILDWQYEDGVLVYALLREWIPQKDRLTTHDERFRELSIIDSTYTQTITVGDQSETITPQVAGGAIDYIPFIIHQPTYEQVVAQPPLLDLANLALNNYRLKADHMHALHYAALPTPWITGVDPESGPTTIGPQKIWKLPNDQASVGMLEFTGAGVASIEKELDRQEDQMAILGSRILLPEVSENTATASKLRSISETSDLASIVVILEKQLTQLLQFTALWAGVTGEVEIMIDTNFLPSDLDSGQITALVGAWQAGAFPYRTLVDNFKKAEIIAADDTIEELEADTEKEEEDRMVKAADAIKLATDAAGGEDDEEDEDE